VRGCDGGCESRCGAVSRHAGGGAVGGRLLFLFVRLCLFRHGRGVVLGAGVVVSGRDGEANGYMVSASGRAGAKEYGRASNVGAARRASTTGRGRLKRAVDTGE